MRNINQAIPIPLRVWVGPALKAMRKEIATITNISATTEAPISVRPSRLRSTPSSSSTWAEMLVLVAARRTPMKRLARGAMLKRRAIPTPITIGTTTPIVPADRATLPALAISRRSISNPAMNIRKITPSSAR